MMLPFLIVILCFALCLICILFLLPQLKRRAEQPIYEEGPSWHKKKQGTPTMGGVGFLSGILICSCGVLCYLFLAGRQSTAISLLLNLSYALLNSAVGIFDDIKKIKRKQNEGLTPRQKLFYQLIIAALYLSARAKLIGIDTEVKMLGLSLDLGFFFYPMMLFVMLGIVNCANLTDGIDALAGSVALAIGVVILVLSINSDTDAPILGALMIGAALAFLLFNLNPARLFMGDSGSLLFGALAIGAAFSLGQPLWILILGVAYIIEGVSVVVQVVSYQVRKKRVFKMAPLHHHLELCGMHENTISYLGFLITLLASALLIFIR